MRLSVKRLQFGLISLLILLSGAGVIAERTNQTLSSLLIPDRLRCEYMKNPLGLDTFSPRFSWIVRSDQRGQKQTAYQLLVSSSKEFLNQDQGDLWDSGKVDSDRTLHISYQGKKLVSYQRCFWKVRVWDIDGKVSGWSEPAFWSMGILSKELWKGQWLGYTTDYTPEQLKLKGSWKQASPSPVFRKEFVVSKEIQRADLYICGLGYHEAYLNGEKIGDHVLDPAYTRYDRACLYVTHDVTDMLQKGGNALGVMLGNGWYNVFTDAAWDFNEAPWRAKPTVLAQLRIEYNDGSTEMVVTDQSWKASAGPVILDGIRQGECYDGRAEMEGWDEAGFDDRGWDSVKLVSGPKGQLRAQMMPPIKVIDTVRPVKVTEPRPGVFVFDLGQNIAGWAKLQVSAPAGTKVQMLYGERLADDGTVDQKNIKVHTYEDTFQTDVYMTKGHGLEVWEPRFVYHGFQYVEVTGYPGKPGLDAIRGRVVHTAFEPAGRFECSNEKINKIQQFALWSYRGNFHGYPTDCPHREKNGWTGDAHLAVEQAMYNWANGAAYTKWMMDFHDEQRDSGELPGIVPTGGWGYHWGNGPAWDSAYLIIPWQMYRYYGDTRILQTHYDRFKRYVDYLTSKADNHIVSIGLGDWAPAKTKTPEAVTSTVFYYRDAMITSHAAEILGHSEDALKYATLAGQIKEAFNKQFYKGDGIYDAGSQTALCFPLYYGLVPDSEQGKVIAKLAENIRSQGYHIDTGILGAKAIFNVLSENGEHDTAYRMLIQPGFPGYVHWIDQEATTLWEDWSGKSSRNHIMYGDISAWFYKNLAGINLNEEADGSEAFKRFMIRPRLVGDLSYVNATYESIRGRICSTWKIDGGRGSFSVEIPANCSAVVYVPAAEAGLVTESGNDVRKSDGVRFIKYEAGYAILEVSSGAYRFQSRLK